MAGVELGGTKCICILASGPDHIVDQLRIPTRSPHDTLKDVRGILDEWKSTHGFEAVGVGSFGPLDLTRESQSYGRVINTSKSGWNNANVLEPLLDYAVPLALDTDVNAAAKAEGRWGAARGLADFAYVTIGTGIGVGSMIGGRTPHGLGHCEAGHLRIPRLPGSKWAGNCPYHGDCVEGLASGPAIEAQAGMPAEDLPLSHAVWEEAVHAVASLMHNLVLTMAPRRILVGGGLGMGQPELLPRIRTALLESLSGYGIAAAIAAQIEDFVVTAELGGNAGPLGSIALALDACGS